jgi:methylmalonyl-CoA mutase cobalamin-binding subunit
VQKEKKMVGKKVV